MKKALLVILLAIVAVGLAGCEDYDTKPLQFINSSDYVVKIISLSIEWTGFVLAPGENRKMTDIRDVDYTYEPADKVQEGFASTARYIVFVNADPVEKDPDITIVVENDTAIVTNTVVVYTNSVNN